MHSCTKRLCPVFHALHMQWLLQDDSLIFFVHFVTGLPGSRFFKVIVHESHFVKFPNPVDHSYVQSQIPALKIISQIPDLKKPIGYPHASQRALRGGCVHKAKKFLDSNILP